MKQKTEKLKQYKCGICGELMGYGITGEWNIGNNSFPIKGNSNCEYEGEKDSDRCCDVCNDMYVIPSRKHIHFNLEKDNQSYIDILTDKEGWILPKYDMVSIWNDRYKEKELV